MEKLALTAKAVSVLEADISLVFEDGSVKTLKLKEGEKVNNLVYVVNGVKNTITGYVKVINTTETRVTDTAACIHDAKSLFSRKVSIQSILVDASKEYESNIVVIPVSAIKDFETTDLSPMTVTSVALESNSTVAIVSTVKPVVAIWNGTETIIPVEGDEAGKYIIPVSSMNKSNELVLLDANSTYKTIVTGVDPVAIIPTRIMEEYNTVVNTVLDTFYNKGTDGQVFEPTTEQYYVKVAEGIGAATEATINGTVYGADQEVSLSVGNNAKIKQPMFKTENGGLYLAAPMMFAVADENGNIEIEVNGFKLFLDLPLDQNAIVLDSVVALGGKEGYKNVATLVEANHAVHERQDGTAYIGWLLKANGTPVAKDTPIFTKKEYSDGNPTTYGIMSATADEKYTEATYNYWLNGAIEKPFSRTITYTVTLLGVGRIVFDLEMVETVKGAEEAVEPETPEVEETPVEE